jgi:monoamine oxidase
MGAAMELEKSGTPYILLEARDRLGGRSWTSTPVGEGMPLDMGSSWIHGTIDNPIMKFAKEFSLPTTPGDWNTWSTSYAYWTNGSLMSENAKETAGHMWDTFNAQTEEVSRGNASMSYREAASIVFEKYGYNQTEQTLMIWLSSILIGDCGGDDISWVTPGANGCDVRGTQVILPNGYGELIRMVSQKYINQSSIRLNAAVTGLYQDEECVHIQTNTPLVFKASKVILTVPLGVLQHKFIDFVPELTAPVRNAISHIGSGPVEKVIVRFNETLPLPSDRPFVFYMPEEEGEFPAVVNFANVTAEKDQVMVFFCAGKCALIADREGKKGLVRYVMKILNTISPNFPLPVAAAVTRWNNDEFSRGSYSYVPINGTNREREAFLPPFRNIVFAGEHVNGARYAYTDGAYISGVSAAKAIQMMSRGEERGIAAMRILVHRSYVVDCASMRGKRSRFGRNR